MDQITSENTKAQMRKGILDFLILLVISRGPVYASDILKELKENEMIVVEGTIYPLLSRLKDSGLLQYVWQESNAGPPRKYYKLTKSGAQALKSQISDWQTFEIAVRKILGEIT